LITCYTVIIDVGRDDYDINDDKKQTYNESLSITLLMLVW